MTWPNTIGMTTKHTKQERNASIAEFIFVKQLISRPQNDEVKNVQGVFDTHGPYTCVVQNFSFTLKIAGTYYNFWS